MIVDTCKKSLLDAWNMLIEFSLPFLRYNTEEDTIKTENAVLLTQCFFPLIGVVCALLALLLAGILGTFLHPIPTAAIFAGTLTYFCVYKDDGRGLAGLMTLASFKKENFSLKQAFTDLPDSIACVSTPTATLTMVLIILFKLFVFFVMAFYGYIYWLVAIFTLEFCIEGYLATLPSFEQGEPLLAINKTKQHYIWFITGFIVLFVLFKAPVTSLILFGVAFGLSHGVKAYCNESLNGINGKIIGLTAYVFELFALLLGLIFLTKGQVILL